MNREIKFRGKRKLNGLWMYGSYIQIGNDWCHIVPEGTEYDEISSEMVRVITESVGQYTGLHDKNGKEIYEGDIITNYEFPANLLIGFCTENAAFVGSKSNSFDINEIYNFANDIVFTDGWEIIGNIFENPELLTR